jgi:hypothetical protein
MGIRKKPEYV